MSSRTGQNVHLPTSNQQSSPAPTGHPPPTNRQEVTDDGGRGRPTAMQPARSRHASVQASHEASEASEADGVIDALAGMRSSLGLEAPLPT